MDVTGDYSTLNGQMASGATIGEAEDSVGVSTNPSPIQLKCSSKTCPTKQCSGGKAYTCEAKFKYVGTHTPGGTTVLTWSNRGAGTTAAQTANWNALVAAVAAHEQGHHDTAAAAVAAYNQAHSADTTMTSDEKCSEAEARQDLNTKFQSGLDAELASLEASEEAAQVAYHARVGATINVGTYLK